MGLSCRQAYPILKIKQPAMGGAIQRKKRPVLVGAFFEQSYSDSFIPLKSFESDDESDESESSPL